MTVLLNNTILSNFSTVARPDLVRQAFPREDIVTVAAVLAEHTNGVSGGHFAVCDWSWLTVLQLTPVEQEELERMPRRLGLGESACLVIAKSRGLRFATDDWDARRAAQRLGIPITGTVGVLAILVKDDKLTLAEADELLAHMIAAGFLSPVTSVKDVIQKG
ncbi:MAG: hypothetical protein L0Y55_03515 [Anaerolineales bacterium]|nr:hypothetical protein [Anaerolineales bacterium]